MRYRLELELVDAEGAIARVLDVIERRGFRARDIQGQTGASSAQGQWSLAISIEGSRDADNLCLQLSKLHDCNQIRMTHEQQHENLA